MLEFLPQNVKEGLSRLNLQKVYEIRLRAEKPTTVNYEGEYRYLGFYGITDVPEKAFVCSQEEIADCVFRAGKYSVYSVEEQIKRGFLTADGGERIGLAGEYVFEKGQPLALRNITSLCIRVPHEIRGCGAEIYRRCMQERLRSVLIISPPGLGKTTLLRDMSRILAEKTKKNVLVCDERGEIAAGEVGASADVLKFADKATAFEAGIRAMRPDVIVTDELYANDCKAVARAISAGICVLASAHFSSLEALTAEFKSLFDRYVVLRKEKIGEIEAIYNREGKLLL